MIHHFGDNQGPRRPLQCPSIDRGEGWTIVGLKGLDANRGKATGVSLNTCKSQERSNTQIRRRRETLNRCGFGIGPQYRGPLGVTEMVG